MNQIFHLMTQTKHTNHTKKGAKTEHAVLVFATHHPNCHGRGYP
ncbi:hypothetical protein E9M_03899 [Moraxella catarrhalis 46P47B1]|nr:hypothetical protein E9M_03899 [Moraxella catarrhalis 46P47B1]